MLEDTARTSFDLSVVRCPHFDADCALLVTLSMFFETRVLSLDMSGVRCPDFDSLGSDLCSMFSVLDPWEPSLWTNAYSYQAMFI